MRIYGLSALLLTLSSLASAQEVLSATYTFGTLRAEFEGSCPVGSQVLLAGEYGTLTFLPDGSFALAGTETNVCTSGTTGTSSFSGTGTYTLDLAGNLVLDLDPMNPGTEVVDLFLSADRQVFVEQAVEPGEPNIAVGVRQSSGLSDADLAGDYAAGVLVQDVGTTGVELVGGFGSFQFDGLGGFTNTITELAVDSAGGSASGTFNDSGTYQVQPNGQLLKNGSAVPVGQLSPDGRFGFAMGVPGATSELLLFVKKKGAPPSTAAGWEGWVVASYGGANGLPGGEVEVEDTTGVLFVDGPTGTTSISADVDFLSNQTNGGGSGTAAGTISIAADGALTYQETGDPYSDPGWLGASERLVIVATVASNSGGPALALLVRERGMVTTDTDGVSVSAGGTQTLSIRAGDELGGKPYMVLGTGTGTWPGLPWGGAIIPLNYSAYLLLSLNSLNVAPFGGTFGTLDANGDATASITLPPGTYASVAGAKVVSSAIVFDPPGFQTVLQASRPVPLEFLP